jgi:tryptophan synthase alpha chain
MNRYQKTFEQLKNKNESACIPFAVAGDPDIDKSLEIFKAYIDGGADILEIGYPFSDPVADGPVNQRASQRAIASGLNHAKFFSLIKKIRIDSEIPIGVLLYANSIYHLGYEQFCRKAADAGIDSLLVADLPPEESAEFAKATKACGIGRVYIVSELTSPQRIKYICDNVDSFVYVVSRLGATGVGKELSSSVPQTISRIRSITDKPLAVGFGISNPEHVAEVVKTGANGVIIGSALVSVIENNLTKTNELPSILKKKVASFKAATRLKE